MSFSVPDWEEFLRSHERKGLPEIELGKLRAGDRLLVVTSNTAYEFRMKSAFEAELSTNRDDRPSGPVKLNGCTFGASSTIKPGYVFCGGNLEFFLEQLGALYSTTEIRALRLTDAVGVTIPS